jgi:hypothetical protein
VWGVGCGVLGVGEGASLPLNHDDVLFLAPGVLNTETWT